eukprot:UN22903
MEVKKEFSGSPIRLNVGGRLFITTLETLRKDKDSKLTLLFSGDSDNMVKIDKDTYFLDEDPDVFKYILDFLRNGRLEASFRNIIPHFTLRSKAQFYKLNGLQKELDHYLGTDVRQKGVPIPQLVENSLTVYQINKCGYFLQEFEDAHCSMQYLYDGGFSLKELRKTKREKI